LITPHDEPERLGRKPKAQTLKTKVHTLSQEAQGIRDGTDHVEQTLGRANMYA